MTVRIPPKNILDKILRIFGKERKVDTDGIGETYEKYGPYVQVMAKRGGF